MPIGQTATETFERTVAAVHYTAPGFFEDVSERGVDPNLLYPTDEALSRLIWNTASENDWRVVSRGPALRRGPIPLHNEESEVVSELLQTYAYVVFAEKEVLMPIGQTTRYSWTQAICNECWDERNPQRPSPRVNPGDPERCAYCGLGTTSGIYVREDPTNVSYPRPKED